MLNNLVNVHDVSRLIRKAKKRQLSSVFSGLKSNRVERVQQAWQHTQGPPLWTAIPDVGERQNLLISGDANVDYYEYITHKYFSDRELLYALSLGCGSGIRELKWAELGKFKRIDAYDLSASRIHHAVAQAREKGYDKIIHYCTADVYKVGMSDNFYDVVLAEDSLHHFSPLKEILLRIHRTLKPTGYFIVNEFVGPTRFHWTARQIEVVNGLLSILPFRYKTQWNSDSVRPNAFRPSRLSMILRDPSEAVESSDILPLLNQIFEVVEIREYGGSILSLLFSGIAHNFLSEDDEAQRFLHLCFEVEDLLLKSGDIQSDFALVVCKKQANCDS